MEGSIWTVWVKKTFFLSLIPIGSISHIIFLYIMNVCIMGAVHWACRNTLDCSLIFSTGGYSCSKAVMPLAAWRPSVSTTALWACWTLTLLTGCSWWQWETLIAAQRPARVRVPLQPLVWCQRGSQLHKCPAKVPLSQCRCLFLLCHVETPLRPQPSTATSGRVSWFILTFTYSLADAERPGCRMFLNMTFMGVFLM